MPTATARAFRWRYVLALSLIAALSIGAHATLEGTTSSQRANAKTINVAGQQRMLSQRIALLAAELSGSQARAPIRAAMKPLVALMARSQAALLHGDQGMGVPGSLTPQLRSLYYRPPANLAQRVADYLAHARRLADGQGRPDRAGLVVISIAERGELLPLLDRAVTLYQTSAEAAVDRLRQVATLILAATLLALLLEAVFVFRPMTRRIRRQLEALAVQQRALRQRALRDDLTSLANRAAIYDELRHALARAGRRQSRACLLFMDLDGFKTINDSFGHAVGDKVLSSVAQRLETAVRQGDHLARFGGDEFLILAEDIGDATAAFELAARVLDTLTRPLEIDGPRSALHVRASMGIALSDPEATPDSLIAQADIAMYQAKRSGGDRIKLHPTADGYETGGGKAAGVAQRWPTAVRR